MRSPRRGDNDGSGQPPVLGSGRTPRTAHVSRGDDPHSDPASTARERGGSHPPARPGRRGDPTPGRRARGTRRGRRRAGHPGRRRVGRLGPSRRRPGDLRGARRVARAPAPVPGAGAGGGGPAVPDPRSPARDRPQPPLPDAGAGCATHPALRRAGHDPGRAHGRRVPAPARSGPRRGAGAPGLSGAQLAQRGGAQGVLPGGRPGVGRGRRRRPATAGGRGRPT